MLRTSDLFTGLALGAGAAYFFDTTQGNRRRKLLADQINDLAHEFACSLDVARRDLANRAQGAIAQVKQVADLSEVTDETLIQRVRATMGHYASTAHRIEVGSNLGHVVLRGPILRDELAPLLGAVGSVPGVRTVTDELVVQDDPPPGRRRATPRGLLGTSPGMQLLGGGLGAAMVLNCLTSRRPGLVGYGAGLLGLGLLARTLSGYSACNQVTFHKTITINASPDKVFNFIMHPEQWPLVTTRIRNLQMHSSDSFSKDIVTGGMGVHCAERITCVRENECFATESLPDSMLVYEKQLHLERSGTGTKLHLQFTYNPPGGLLGHTAAALFGLDAKSFFDDFLMRAKTFLETGLQPHDVAKQMYGQRESQHPQNEGVSERRGDLVDRGPNAPPHDVPIMAAGLEETDMLQPIEGSLHNPVEHHEAEMRNHI